MNEGSDVDIEAHECAALEPRDLWLYRRLRTRLRLTHSDAMASLAARDVLTSPDWTAAFSDPDGAAFQPIADALAAVCRGTEHSPEDFEQSLFKINVAVETMRREHPDAFDPKIAREALTDVYLHRLVTLVSAGACSWDEALFTVALALSSELNAAQGELLKQAIERVQQ